METRANHLLVGSFVLLLIAGLVVFVVWLARFQFEAEFERYDILFEGRVTGLSVGSKVSLRGVPVGEVRDIGIDPDNVERVRVTIEVAAETPVREDTVASLEQQGITGVANILLSGGSQDSPPLVAAAGEPRPVIRVPALRPRAGPRGRAGTPRQPQRAGRSRQHPVEPTQSAGHRGGT